MTVNIDVPDLNDSLSRVTLANQEFLIRFTWNATQKFWTFGLYDISKNPVIHATKIVPYSPLNYFYKKQTFPKGTFGCMTNQKTISRDDFINGVATFFFIPESDLASWNVEDAYE